MNLNKKIGVLLDNGFEPKFISSLNENKINFLFEKISKRKENKEAVTKNVTQTTMTQAEFDTSTKAGTPIDGTLKKNQDGTYTVTKTEGEISEKFESKAQQGLFWARCNKCEDKNCEWCKRADEFSKKTSKKQYKNMPKYKKKETNEEFTMANYFDKVASVYANNTMGKTVNSLTKEQIINKHLTKLVESNLKPTMKKRDLLRLIESENKNKKNLNEDFYYDEISEDFDMMSRYEGEPNWYEEDEEDYEEYDMSPGSEEPGMPPSREYDDTPRPRNKMSRLSRRMNDPAIVEPDIDTDPDIDPAVIPIKEPDEWEGPDRKEPNIRPGTNPNPMGDKNSKINKFKRDFDRTMSRMDESNYKPIKYRKY